MSDTERNSSYIPSQCICYIYSGPLFSRAASAVQVMKMCEGFTQVGYRPLLIARNQSDGLVGSDGPAALFDYHGIRHHFDVCLMQMPQLPKGGVVLRALNSILFARRAVTKAACIMPRVLYTRDIYTAWFAVRRGLPVVFEEHEPPRRKMHEYMRRRLFCSPDTLGVVFISHALEAYYRRSGLICGRGVRTLVAHDAAPLSHIRSACRPAKCRGGKIVVGYVGSFLRGRGVQLILVLAGKLSQFQFKLVGGTLEEMTKLSSQPIPSNVECSMFVEPGEVPKVFEGMDILIMPYQNDTTTNGGTISTQWMSPLKMFEYMASGVPLISSDLPVLREVLVHDQNALMVSSADANAWCEAIVRLASDRELRQRLSRNAEADVMERFNWPARAKRILAHLVPEVHMSP